MNRHVCVCRIGRHDEFLVFTWSFRCRRACRARKEFGPCRYRHRRPQLRRWCRVRAHQIRALPRRKGTAEMLPRKSSGNSRACSKSNCRWRTPGFHRWLARHPGLSAGSRRLGTAHALAHGRQGSRGKRRLHPRTAGSCWIMLKDSISLSCRRRGSMPSALGRASASVEGSRAASVWLAASLLYRGDDARRLANAWRHCRQSFRPADCRQ